MLTDVPSWHFYAKHLYAKQGLNKELHWSANASVKIYASHSQLNIFCIYRKDHSILTYFYYYLNQQFQYFMRTATDIGST